MTENELRFYMMCALLGRSGAQTRELARRLVAHPEDRIIDHIGKNHKMSPRDREFEIVLGSPALVPNQTGKGLVYNREDYRAVCQEVKNWAVVTGQDAATARSIRGQYMSGGIHPWAGIAWNICDDMDTRAKDICWEVVRDSPQSKAFRAA